jgi:hypothetical protein
MANTFHSRTQLQQDAQEARMKTGTRGFCVRCFELWQTHSKVDPTAARCTGSKDENWYKRFRKVDIPMFTMLQNVMKIVSLSVAIHSCNEHFESIVRFVRGKRIDAQT